MPSKLPLSLTLSPSDGEREQGVGAEVRIGVFSLSPSDGERVRERGLCN